MLLFGYILGKQGNKILINWNIPYSILTPSYNDIYIHALG